MLPQGEKPIFFSHIVHINSNKMVNNEGMTYNKKLFFLAWYTTITQQELLLWRFALRTTFHSQLSQGIFNHQKYYLHFL